MNHTITALEKIVDTHNHSALSLLAAARPAMFQRPPALSPGNADRTSTLPSYPLGSWDGILSKNTVPSYDLLRAALSLNAKGDTAAVFSIVDNFRNHDVDEEEEFPVALCVGINYIQKATYTRNLPLRSDTEMREGVSKVINRAEAGFHLVAANFFPWVTVGEWKKATGKGLNSLHEMLLLNVCGFDDPVAHAASLAKRIDPEWLIFHGVDNCVPLFGVKVRDRLRRDVIFCDNISRRKFPTWNRIRF